MDDSCVRFLMVSNNSSGSADLTATHCIRPVPSRKIGNAILPDRRKLYSHPGISTVSPTCWAASAIVILSAILISHDETASSHELRASRRCGKVVSQPEARGWQLRS